MNTLIDASIALAQQSAPYLAHAIAAMDIVVLPDEPMVGQHPTTACDKYWRVYIHSALVEGDNPMPPRELAHCILHELSHLLHGHFGRCEMMGGDPAQFTIAGDLEIESHDWPGLTRPKFGVTPSRLKLPTGLTTEDYYRLIEPKQNSKPCCGGGSGAGAPKDFELGPRQGFGTEYAEALRQQAVRAINEAESKQAGTVPAGLARLVTLCKPPVSLRRLIRQWTGQVTQHAGCTRNWRTTKVKRGMVIPGKGQLRPRIAIVADTSGSMSDGEIAKAIRIALDAARICATVDVAWVDVDTVWQKNVRALGEIKPVGGGGTDLREAIRQSIKGHDGVIVVTDCETPWDASPPSIPAIVVSTQRGAKAPTPWRTVEANP